MFCACLTQELGLGGDLGSGRIFRTAPSDLGVQLFIFEASEGGTLRLESKKWNQKGLEVFVRQRVL